MIPRIIHQTWKSRTAIPPDLRAWRESFASLNPGWDLRLYDDADNRALVASFCPGLLPIYDAFPAEIYRADFVRPVYLYRDGGIYADMDMQCLQPLEHYAFRDGVVLGSMGDDLTGPHSLPNAMMASAAGHGFWLLYLALIVARARALGDGSSRQDRKVEHVTGPVVLHAAHAAHGSADAAATVARFREEFPDIPAPWNHAPLVALQGHVWFPFDWRDPANEAARRRMRGWSGLLPAKLLALVGAPMLAPTIAESRAEFPRSEAVTYWRHSW